MTCVLEKILGEFQKEARAVVSDMEKCRYPQDCFIKILLAVC